MQQPKPAMDQMISSPDSNEYVNTISHLIGAFLACSVVTLLIILASLEHKWLLTVSFAVYGVTLFTSLIVSCLLHLYLLVGIYKRILGILDHCAIYLLIAGTYTPLCLTIVRGMVGWLVLSSIWSLALVFSVIKVCYFVRIPPVLSILSYLMLGWLAVLLLPPIARALGRDATLLIGCGGLLYSLGALIFAHGKPNPRPPYFGSHEIWHLAVLAGHAVFAGVMLLFVLPYPS